MKRHAQVALSLLLALAFGLSLTHAEDEPQTRGEQGDILTPLAIGNTWIYSSDGDEMITTDRVEGMVLFDTKPWYLLRSYERSKDQPTTANTLLDLNLWLAMINGYECDASTQINSGDGVLELADISQYYRYPVALGETYHPYQDDPAMVMTVIALHEKTKTKSGEFDCVVYKQTDTTNPGYSYTSYMAPGIGLIKYYTTEDGETSGSELISYSLAEDE